MTKLVPLGLQLQVPIQSSGGTFTKPNSPDSDSDVLEAASVSLTHSALDPRASVDVFLTEQPNNTRENCITEKWFNMCNLQLHVNLCPR